jgi:hypothetical protein
MKLKEINILKYKKQKEEQKLVLLMEGKLNKQEIKNYRNSIKKEILKSNTNDKINIKNDYFIKENVIVNNDKIMKNTEKDGNISKENIFRNKKSKNNSGIKSYSIINNNENYLKEKYLTKKNLSTINTLKNKSNQFSINNLENNIKNKNFIDYMTFSPSLIANKNLELSPNIDRNNNIIELDQLVSFSPKQKENINEGSFNENNMNNIYEKKGKKNIKRISSYSNKNNNKLYEPKNIKENLINYKDNKDELNIINNYNINQTNEISLKIKSDKDINNNNEINDQNIKDPFIKYYNSYLSRNSNDEYKELRETKKKEENKEKVANFIKETNNELLKLKNNKYLYNNEEKIINQKPFVEDSIFLKGIKKEDTTEIEQIKNKEIENKKDNKENLQLNFINNINEKKYLSKTSRNTNKNKKKIIFNNEHNIDKNEENK